MVVGINSIRKAIEIILRQSTTIFDEAKPINERRI